MAAVGFYVVGDVGRRLSWGNICFSLCLQNPPLSLFPSPIAEYVHMDLPRQGSNVWGRVLYQNKQFFSAGRREILLGLRNTARLYGVWLGGEEGYQQAFLSLVK